VFDEGPGQGAAVTAGIAKGLPVRVVSVLHQPLAVSRIE